ncbi:MAG: hypothetical protein WCP97_02395 [bacterium]
MFYITSMPASRPADYYLGCLEGSVFLDFNNFGSGQVSLRRISFDGYGCWNLNNQVIPINTEDSIVFKKMMKVQAIEQETLTTIIKKTINDNKKLIGENALAEYGFV